MKTPVHKDPQEDARQMKLSYADPRRFDDRKLFPNSDWEFDKWNKTDVIGFLVSALVAVVIILFLLFLTNIGSS